VLIKNITRGGRRRLGCLGRRSTLVHSPEASRTCRSAPAPPLAKDPRTAAILKCDVVWTFPLIMDGENQRDKKQQIRQPAIFPSRTPGWPLRYFLSVNLGRGRIVLQDSVPWNPVPPKKNVQYALLLTRSPEAAATCNIVLLGGFSTMSAMAAFIV
jgi:hypothetical protein